MTTKPAPSRAYSVFVDVPRIFCGLITFKDSETFVDKGLQPGQIDSYGLDANRAKTIAACILTTMILWIVPVTIGMVQVLSSLMIRDYTRLAWTLGSVLLWIAAIWVSMRFIGRREKAFTEAIADLGPRITPVPTDHRHGDLRRIQEALNSLQKEHGSEYDDRARDAVVAVLGQDVHRPDEKHLIIADSTADDADSVAIRTRTLQDKAAWGQDVARAEHFILALEDAAGAKVPTAV